MNRYVHLYKPIKSVLKIKFRLWCNNIFFQIPTPETSNSMFRYFDNSMFKLPFPMICKDSQFSNSSFYLNRTRHRLTTTNNNEVNFKEKSNCSCMKYSSKSCKIDQNLSTDSSKMEIVQKEGKLL